MNTTTKPGVLAVMDAAEQAKPAVEPECLDCAYNPGLCDTHDGVPTSPIVMAEQANPDDYEAPCQPTEQDDEQGDELREARATFRGEQP